MAKQPDQSITITGDQAINSAVVACAKYAAKHIIGFSNRMLASRAAKEIEDFAKSKDSLRTDLVAIYGHEYEYLDALGRKQTGQKVDEVALARKGGKDWEAYKKAKAEIFASSFELKAFTKKLKVEIPEDAVANMNGDELAGIDMLFDVETVAPVIDWKARAEKAEAQLAEIADKAKPNPTPAG